MISLKIVPEHQRLGLLRDGQSCHLLGPGIVFVLRLPGRQYVLISIGDHCRLMTYGHARFCGVLLQVELHGSATSGMMRVIGFSRHTILVAGEDTEALRVEVEPVPAQKAVPQATRRGFWIGLPVILFFAAISWMGVWYSAGQITTERTVYQRGVLVAGTVVERLHFRPIEVGEQTHYVAYKFQTPADVTVRNEIRIDPEVWNCLTQNGPIAIRYVPDKPELNLPDGWHMEDFFYLTGGFAMAGAVLFSVVLVGMLIKKLFGGCRSEGSMSEAR
jgi:hypothetical protein